MKNIFIKCFFALCVLFALVSCDSKRPGTSENFVIDVAGTSILKNAEVTLYSEGKEVAKTNTDEDGKFEMKDVSSATGLNISVCKGAFHSVASEKDVDFTGCLETYIPVAQENISAVVDFLSTFISKYDETLEEKTALEEWSEYLSMTTSPAPELQEALTDATKRYLWQQGLSKLAEQVSQANNITPESMFSTENLFNLLIADLVDDSIINGSTKTKIGNMDINALVLKNYIADAIPKVSETFSAADLSEWTDKIRYSDAKFLGGEGKGSTNNEINISLDVYPEGSKGAHPDFYSGNVIVEAAAEPATLVVSLKCYAGESEIPNDLDEKDQFEGSFSTLEIENDTVLKIRCDASDGVSIKSVEKEITINNDAPITTATLFESGTNIVTGTAENPAKSRVDLKVEAKHAKYNIDEVVCSLENYTLKNTATANYQFAAVIDTTELPEGTNTLKCTATMNQNKFSSEFDFIVRNTVIVTVKPFVVNPLSEIKSVDVDCGENFKGHYTALQDISLKRGQICTITVSGGKFQSVTLESIKEFGSSLSSVVIPESDADIIITPATTIDEIVYSSRVSAGEDAAETFEKSKDSLLKHFSQAFSWNTEPKNTQSMDATTKYYILLAGLENLAYFMEMQINTNHGAYNIGNIIDLLRDDYSDLTFDGAKNGSKLVFGTENKFELDANFFRYYYATAIKRFLAGDFNATGITNIGSILNQISTNSDQYLFPANSETIAIESDGPIITIDSFKNLCPYREEDGNSEDYIDGELATYMPLGEETGYLETTSEKQPYFAQAFILNFTVKSNNGNYIDLNSLEISEEDSGVFRYTRLSPAEIPGDGFTNEETEFSFLVEYSDDGAGIERQIDFAVSVEDVAFNGNAVSVKSFLDSKAPTFNNIFMSEIAATTGADNFSIYYKVSDNALSKVGYCIYRTDTETDEITGEENTVETLIKCSVNTLDDAFEYDSTIEAARINTHLEEALDEGIISEKDGNYSVVISAVDRAGNTRSERRDFVFDTTPPEIPNMEFTNYEDAEYIGTGYYVIARTKLWHLVLSEPGNDVDSWRVGVYCRRDFTPANYSDSALNNYKTWAKTLGDYAATFDIADIELPSPQQGKFGVCVFYHEVCDLLKNCNSSEGNTLFFIDDEAPELVPINGNNYDVDLSVLTECTHNDNSGSGFVVLPNCIEAANCVQENGQILIGSRQAQVLVKYTDNLFDPEENGINLNVSITHNSRGWTRDCQYASGGGTCSKYWCDLSNSNNGSNSYTITASDGLNTSEPLILTLNIATALDNPRPTLTKTFFTENSASKLTWTETSGITYTCKIKKDGDSSFEKSCTNGGTISQGKGVNGSGKYQIVLRSTNGNGDYKDTTLGFTYFETKDLTVTFTPIAHQFLSNNGAFQFKTKVESSPAIAKITKIQYYLRGLYQNGSKVNDTEYLVKTLLLNSTSGQTEQVFSQNINLDAYGQFRNIRARITFADGSTLVKDSNFSKENSALYCKLGAVETLNNVQMNFDGNKLSVIYTKPSCITSSDYKLKAFIPAPSTCGGYDAGAEQPTFEENGTSGTSYNIFYGIGLKTNNHTHTSGGITELSYCGAEFKAFSKDTTIRVTYNGGKTADAKGNLSWNNIPVSWSHKPHPKNCNKCNNLSTTVSCTQKSTYSIDLKK